jgi:hypothetical protein
MYGHSGGSSIPPPALHSQRRIPSPPAMVLVPSDEATGKGSPICITSFAWIKKQKRPWGEPMAFASSPANQQLRHAPYEVMRTPHRFPAS